MFWDRIKYWARGVCYHSAFRVPINSNNPRNSTIILSTKLQLQSTTYVSFKYFVTADFKVIYPLQPTTWFRRMVFCGESSDGRVCEMNHGLVTKGIRFGFSEMLPSGDLRLTFCTNILWRLWCTNVSALWNSCFH